VPFSPFGTFYLACFSLGGGGGVVGDLALSLLTLLYTYDMALQICL